MTDDVHVEAAPVPRQVPAAAPARPNRARAAAGLVAELERRSPQATAMAGLSSAAMRAGDLVRGTRHAAGLSQAELAARIGVSQARVSEIEAGVGTQGPTWDVMERIALACGCRVEVVEDTPASVIANAIEDSFAAFQQALDRELAWAGATAWTPPAVPPGALLPGTGLRSLGTFGGHAFVECVLTPGTGTPGTRLVLEPVAVTDLPSPGLSSKG